jgi:hypothetical protein
MMKYQGDLFEEEPKLIAVLAKYKKKLLAEMKALGEEASE